MNLAQLDLKRAFTAEDGTVPDKVEIWRLLDGIRIRLTWPDGSADEAFIPEHLKTMFLDPDVRFTVVKRPKRLLRG